jgi:mannosyl-3-phosphoglycerate phosphatase
LSIVIFSDLDGTLLGARTYSFEAARPALERIRQLRIPLILSSSKTRAEMEAWRERLDNHDPFIVENGGAVVIPGPGGDETIVSGDPYAELVAALRAAAQESGCAVRGFHELDDREVSEISALPLDDARRARQREYDEPFEIPDGSPERVKALLAAIEAHGKRWTRGGRFYHITGDNDKGRAVRTLIERYPGSSTVGIGDAWNDVPLLGAVDVPIVLPSADVERIRAVVPTARVASALGPAGWNAALLDLLKASTAH